MKEADTVSPTAMESLMLIELFCSAAATKSLSFLNTNVKS